MPLPPSTRVGSYQILQPIGAGGMGEVYRARDEKLHRDVAIKVLPAAFAGDADRLARFRREAQVLAALNHPNIASVYGLEDFGGGYALVMELVDGITLTEKLKAGRLPISQALPLAQQAAEALAYAHEKGIIHRDLKPGNLMLTPAGQIKVLDFGLAKRHGRDLSGDSQASEDTLTTPITEVGDVLGTPAFMSPEQSVGAPTDARSDIFSFGAILFEMLTGQRAFHGPSRLEVLQAVITATPPSLASLGVNAPLALEQLLARMFAKRREDRIQTSAEVASSLRAIRQENDWLTAQGSAVRKPMPGPRSRPRWAIPALAILLAAGGYFAWPHLSRLRPGAPSGTAWLDRSLPAHQLVQTGRNLARRYDLPGNLDRAIEAFQAALQKDPQSAPARAELAMAYWRKNAGSPDPTWLNLAADNARQAVQVNPSLAVAHLSLGVVLTAQGKRDEAEAEVRRALELDPQSSEAHLRLAPLLDRAGKPDEAARYFQKAIALDPKAFEPLAALGGFQFRRGEYAQAVASFEKCLALVPDSVGTYRNLAGAYYAMERWDDAAATLQRGLEITPTASLHSNLGTLQFFQGRYRDSADNFEKAVQLSGNNYLGWGNLADAYRWLPGNEAKSAEAYVRAIDLVRDRIKTNPADAEARSTLATYLAKSGDRAAALAEVATLEKLPDPRPAVLFKMAQTSEIAGQRAKAITFLASAVRKGYPMREIKNDPELATLRSDPNFYRLVLRNAPKP